MGIVDRRVSRGKLTGAKLGTFCERLMSLRNRSRTACIAAKRELFSICSATVNVADGGGAASTSWLELYVSICNSLPLWKKKSITHRVYCLGHRLQWVLTSVNDQDPPRWGCCFPAFKWSSSLLTRYRRHFTVPSRRRAPNAWLGIAWNRLLHSPKEDLYLCGTNDSLRTRRVWCSLRLIEKLRWNGKCGKIEVIINAALHCSKHDLMKIEK